jgi:hypothetical protein
MRFERHPKPLSFHVPPFSHLPLSSQSFSFFPYSFVFFSSSFPFESTRLFPNLCTTLVAHNRILAAAFATSTQKPQTACAAAVALWCAFVLCCACCMRAVPGFDKNNLKGERTAAQRSTRAQLSSPFASASTICSPAHSSSLSVYSHLCVLFSTHRRQQRSFDQR